MSLNMNGKMENPPKKTLLKVGLISFRCIVVTAKEAGGVFLLMIIFSHNYGFFGILNNCIFFTSVELTYCFI